MIDRLFAFSAGPEDAKITIGNLTQGQTFDQGNVCANEDSGYIFIQSNCTTSTDVSVVFQQSTYKGPICLDIGGHHLSGMTYIAYLPKYCNPTFTLTSPPNSCWP